MDSETIQIIVGIITAFTSIAAIIISIITLRHSAKVQEEAVRPNIIMYFDIINVGSQQGFFVLKNFGQTGAKITSFTHDINIEPKTEFDERFLQALKDINGLYLAPNQRFIYTYECENHKEVEEDLMRFKIEYEANRRKYYSDSLVRISNYTNIADLLYNTQDFDKATANILKDISIRLV